MSQYRTNEILNKGVTDLKSVICDGNELIEETNNLLVEANALLTQIEANQAIGGGGASSSAIVDAAGRQEVASNVALGEYNFATDTQFPIYFDTFTLFGSVAHNASENAVRISTSSGGDVAYLTTKNYHPYFPGHAQQAEITFSNFQPEVAVDKFVGYFNNNILGGGNFDGFFLKSDGDDGVSLNIANDTDTPIEILQSNWDDPLDGTGASGVTVDWSKFQVIQFDFLYLGGAILNLYHIVDGQKNLVHQYKHANINAGTFIDNPAQPVAALLTTTAGYEGGGTYLDFHCAQVSTSGGGAEFAGIPFGIDTQGLISYASSGTEYVALLIEKTNKNAEVFIKEIQVVSPDGVLAAEAYLWRLHINPTLSGAVATGSFPNIPLDIGIGGGTTTITSPGIVIASGTGASKSTSAIQQSLKNLRIGTAIDGTADQLVLSYIPLAASQTAVSVINGYVIV